MRALVISSGATKMAFGIGVTEELQRRYNYDLYVGISAGSIISMFAACGRLGVLYGALLNSELSDVFDISPITKSGRVSLIALARVIFGKRALSKNGAIKTMFKKLLTQEDYDSIKGEARVGVTNYNLGCIEYPSTKTSLYEDFINWVYASSNIPLLTEPVKVGKHWFCDGGLTHYFGIQEAINAGATEVDVILHCPLKAKVTEEDENWEPKNLVTIGERTLQIMHGITTTNDITLANILAEAKNVKVNFYYPPEPLKGVVYNLDTQVMKDWYVLGRHTAKTT